MMSMTGFSSIPGGLAVRTAIERLGVRRSIQLGLGLSAPQDAMIVYACQATPVLATELSPNCVSLDLFVSGCLYN